MAHVLELRNDTVAQFKARLDRIIQLEALLRHLEQKRIVEYLNKKVLADVQDAEFVCVVRPC